MCNGQGHLEYGRAAEKAYTGENRESMGIYLVKHQSRFLWVFWLVLIIQEGIVSMIYFISNYD